MNRRIIYLLFAKMSLLFFSCRQSSDLISQQISQKGRYVQDNFKNDSHIVTEVENWILSSCEKGIWSWQSSCDASTFRVDKLIFFNKDSTKLVGVVKESSLLYEGAKSDVLKGFQGVKVKGKWYFFPGANIILSRGSYHYDPYQQLTWEELDYLAYKHYMRKFCKIENGKIVPLTEGVEKYIRLDVQKYPEGETDENWIKNYEYSRRKKVTEKEKRMTLKRMKESKRPNTKVEIPTFSWWDKMRGYGPPIFETDEWKNRRVSK